MNRTDIHRVLMTGDTVGGVWTFTLDLAGGLAGQGIEVLLATLGKMPTPEQGREAAQIPNLHLASKPYKLDWMDDPWEDVAASGKWLLGLEHEYAPDLVHLNSYGHGALSWAAPVVVTAHSCVASWWAAVKREPLPPAWGRYKREVASSLQAADLVVAPTRAMFDTLGQNYGLNLDHSRVILNGRLHSAFSTRPKEPFIFAAGRLWDEAKNIQALIQIAPRLHWPVYLAGDSSHPDGRSVSPRGCEILGKLSAFQMAHWYSRASIYALPAWYEPFGLSALEAALSGCALVLGDIPSLREVWGDAAIFAPPGDPDFLAQVLNELIEAPDRRETLAKRGGERARMFSRDRMASEYLEAYSSVVQRRAACAS